MCTTAAVADVYGYRTAIFHDDVGQYLGISGGARGLARRVHHVHGTGLRGTAGALHSLSCVSALRSILATPIAAQVISTNDRVSLYVTRLAETDGLRSWRLQRSITHSHRRK